VKNKEAIFMKIFKNYSWLWIVVVILGLILWGLNKRYTNVLEINQYLATKEVESTPTVTAEQKSRCRRDATIFYEKEKREGDESHCPRDGFCSSVMLSYSFGFNPELNTCLLAWEDMNIFSASKPVQSYWKSHITDIYTNKDIYSWWRESINLGDLEDLFGSEVEYKEKLRQYGL
jgi:hypothetical protein